MLSVTAILECAIMTFSTYYAAPGIMGYILEKISDTVKIAAAEWSIEGIRYLREKDRERKWGEECREGEHSEKQEGVSRGRGKRQ